MDDTVTEATADAARRVQVLATVLAANQSLGTMLAARYQVPGRPFGIELHLGKLTPVLWGTGISAPTVMTTALFAGARSPVRSAAALRALGAPITIGQLAEPVTWQRRRPLPVALAAGVNLVVAPALAFAAHRLATSTAR
ncbi:MAG: hypothetical protein ACXVLO_03025 [Acidimicrobiia bacterium]